ncbi:hypothetical protein XENTR_v10015092 [Xenopus tropicalis]|uniref:Cytochrome P450 2K6 n=1 Tax=Xenopus tropicalis TaxID=8364 RepID=A0A8J0SQ08_XENTR|nr:cytochrome P450 2K6 [Xenopus tropicalis]XP_031758884.1 cytochrome P450 2K6 [Xenopus tropicalis]KAE8605379.1 hypothetical protein XENTR_v10015092 [Xenopus tropicalis]
MDLVSVLLSVVVCIFLYKVFYGGEKESQNFPPGPKPLPLIGNLHIMNMKKPFLTFMELAEKYGPVFSVQLGTKKVVVLCGTDAVKDALVNHADEFSGRPKIPMFDQTSKGHGVIFADGENWKVMRRFTLSTLRDFGMGKKTLEDRIGEESGCLVETFKSHEGKPFDNTLILNAAVANIIVHILLNHRFDYQDPTLLKLIKSVSENVRIGGRPIVMLYNTYPSIMQWVPGSHKSIYENSQNLLNFLKETFTEHRHQLDVNDQRDLIDTFLVKQQEEKSSSTKFFHDENLTILLSNLFGAGMETTSTTLRWGILLMMKYPDIQKKVQDEIDQVIGSAEPRLEHRKQMPYTDAVIHEIQRFANLAPNGLPHATTTDVTFRGYFIPKGTQVIPVLTSVLRDKAYFKKPEEFYPEHFLDSEGKFLKNEAFLPFSAGKRICAGETLAKMELFLFFTKLLQNFTFQPPPGVEVQLTCGDAITSIPLDHKICALSRS